ncbi:MAG: DUF4300 family protein [Firmicutes bacterium]|nr:DUF4300 family protein [Bacillota bacterium]
MRKILISTILILLLILTGCGETEKAAPETYDLTEDNLQEVTDILEGAGLSNVDTFKEWVTEYLEGIPDDPETSGFSDSDCRMNVMLLTGDQISYDNVKDEYDGTYLMFDLDAIENQEGYEILRDKEKLFWTMFGEMPIPEGGLSEALPSSWKEHGISFDNDKASIISVVLTTYEGDAAFVGHTGVLVDKGDGYLFIEKIAFSEPYKVTELARPEDILDIFSSRPDYFSEDGQNTMVYIDYELLGELDASEEQQSDDEEMTTEDDSMTIQEILELEDPEDLSIEMDSYLFDKCSYGENMDALNEYEKTVFLVEELQDEVNNGGFDQYFINSSGDHWVDAIEACKEIGAVKTADLLEKASKAYGVEIPLDYDLRQDMMSELPEDGDYWDKLDELDSIFYGDTGDYEDRDQLIYDYCMKNRDKFN